MTGGDIAALIAAAAFLVLVVLLAVPLIKLGRVLDEARYTIHDVTKDVSPLLKEATDTLATANRELDKLDGVTTHLTKTVENVGGIVASVTGIVSSPLAKFAGILAGLGFGRSGRKSAKSTRKRKG